MEEELKLMSDKLSAIETEFKELKSRISVNSEISGYIVKCICSEYCIAERNHHINCDDFVIWHISDDLKDVWGGSYFNDYKSALNHFISKITNAVR